MTTRNVMAWPLNPVYWGVNVSDRCPAEIIVQLRVETPMIPKAATLSAGSTVRSKLVLTDRLPVSVAVTVTLVAPLTEGVPLMVVPVKVNPGGKPLTE